MHGASEMQGLVARGRRTSLFLVWERSIRLLLHRNYRDWAVIIRTDDMFPLPSAWTCETRLPIKVGIPRIQDTTVPVISGTGVDTVCSFSPQCGPDGPISVSRCGIGTVYYTDRPERPGCGLRPRTGLTG